MSIEGQDWRRGSDAYAPPMLDAPRAGQRVHLALVEIAQFAALRRMVGVQRADLLVLDVAERIASAVSKARVETVGRNLVEVSFTTHSPADVEPVVATIHAAFDQPVCIDGEFHSIGVTIGVAEGPGTESCAVLLVEEAEAALINARRRDPHGSTQAPAGSSPDVAQISRELQEAVGRDELFVQYQPKLHLRRQQIVSVEALIRWLHPTRGLVLPNDFIPVAEQTGDISDITLWTIKRVIADQRVMIRNGHPMPVFINMAGQLLSDTPFIDEVIALIESSGARLGVEITETSVIRDPQGAIKHLERLAAIGVVVTIDDYGAGLSSLAYLKQLPASELKIDKLFVTQLTSSHRDPLIVRSTIDLAHALEMEVVAEGVETAASLALLSVMGCDMVQGYLVSRPLALEALLAFLRDERHLAVAGEARSPLERLAAVRARG